MHQANLCCRLRRLRSICAWPALAAARRRLPARLNFGSMGLTLRSSIVELAGGLNTYGVAEYKLPTADSLREVELIRNMGVEFRLRSAIESAVDLEALEAEFDCIFWEWDSERCSDWA